MRDPTAVVRIVVSAPSEIPAAGAVCDLGPVCASDVVARAVRCGAAPGGGRWPPRGSTPPKGWPGGPSAPPSPPTMARGAIAHPSDDSPQETGAILSTVKRGATGCRPGGEAALSLCRVAAGHGRGAVGIAAEEAADRRWLRLAAAEAAGRGAAAGREAYARCSPLECPLCVCVCVCGVWHKSPHPHIVGGGGGCGVPYGAQRS